MLKTDAHTHVYQATKRNRRHAEAFLPKIFKKLKKTSLDELWAKLYMVSDYPMSISFGNSVRLSNRIVVVPSFFFYFQILFDVNYFLK